MRTTFRPLRMHTWVGEQTKAHRRRGRYTFSAKYQDTLDRLYYELSKLGAKEVVIEADFREQDIKLDGFPRANARVPSFPGVRIAFDSKHGSLVYQCDTHEFWQHNIRAIALGLAALRSVDRYGITHQAEQYTGFKAIDAGGNDPFHSSDEALRWLRQKTGVAGADGISIRTLVRTVARMVHPDAGGNREDWDRYEAATRRLKEANLL